MDKLLAVLTICTFTIVAGQANWFKGCLDSHNKFRKEDSNVAKMEKPNLTLNSTALSHARKRVKELIAGCTFDHNGNKGSGFGENLYVSFGGSDQSCEKAVKKWYDEKQFYNRKQQGFSSKTGHYTQVVWKSTTGLGCAQGTYTAPGCRYQNWKVVVCSYFPPGNYLGQFEKNV